MDVKTVRLGLLGLVILAAIGFGLALQGAAYIWIRHLLRIEP